MFLWPLAASVAASFTRDGVFTLANYETVRRLYAVDVAYTIGVAAAGTALTFAVAIPACGWLRTRAFGPVEFLLKVPLFVPFVVVGHALRVFMSPYVPGFSSSWGGHRGGAGLEAPGPCRPPPPRRLPIRRRELSGGGAQFRGGHGAGDARRAGADGRLSLAVSTILIFSSMLASFSIPLMMGRGGGPQMLMIDVYYRFGQHGDFATASALGVVAYLLAMGAALVYVRRLTSGRHG